jgi:hypothetical protein
MYKLKNLSKLKQQLKGGVICANLKKSDIPNSTLSNKINVNCFLFVLTVSTKLLRFKALKYVSCLKRSTQYLILSDVAKLSQLLDQ